MLLLVCVCQYNQNHAGLHTSQKRFTAPGAPSLLPCKFTVLHFEQRQKREICTFCHYTAQPSHTQNATSCIYGNNRMYQKKRIKYLVLSALLFFFLFPHQTLLAEHYHAITTSTIPPPPLLCVLLCK